MNRSPSPSRIRDRSPKRAEEPLSLAEQSKEPNSLAEQVVQWFDGCEDYRMPRLPFDAIVWSHWHDRLRRFREKHWPDSTERYPYSVVIAFFVDHANAHTYGSYELQVLLSRVCSLAPDVAAAECLVNELPPIAKKLQLEHLLFWNLLTRHMQDGVSFAERLPNGSFSLRYSRPLTDCQYAQQPALKLALPRAPSANAPYVQYLEHHAFSKYAALRDLQQGDSSACDRSRAEAQACMEQLNDTLRPLLDKLVAGGRFGFPTLDGHNSLFNELYALRPGAAASELVFHADTLSLE